MASDTLENLMHRIQQLSQEKNYIVFSEINSGCGKTDCRLGNIQRNNPNSEYAHALTHNNTTNT